VQRFLEYINMYEGSPKENQTVGYHSFDDLSKHPNRRVKFNKRGDKSTAAGAYQLINRTWQDQAKKQGLEDFSLDNQKRAAVGVLKETGALDALMQGDIEKAKQRAARAWASIPGSTIGEATGQRAKFNPRAEKILADVSQPTTVAETKKPAPAPVRAAKRQETVGLSPELARRITGALPIGAAQAADEVPQDRKTKLKQPEPVQASKPTSDLRYRDVPGSPDAVEYERQLRAARPPERSYLEQRGRELLGAPEAALSLLTGAVSPLTGTLYAGGRTLMGKPTTAQEGAEAMTFMPPSESGKESLSSAYRAIEDFKIPAYIPGVGTAGARPKAGKAVSAAEAAKTTAAEARQAAETAKAPRLEGPKPATDRALDLRKLFEEAQERSAKAAETANLLDSSVTPDGRVITGAEKAAALRAGIAKPREFTPSPEAQQLGVEALLRRKRAEQAADVRRAQERAGKAETAADEAMVVAERERAFDRGDKTFAEARRQAEARMNTGAPFAIGASVTPGAVSEAEGMGVVPADQLGSQDAGFPPTPPSGATPFPTPTSEEKPPAAEQKKAFGLDNEDLLMLGLGMLASPGGQAGGELSQLFSNFGRAGLGAVASKREREQQAGEKAYREAMGQYYTQMAKTQGRPDAKERMIERIAKENNISFTDAAKLFAQIEYDPRYAAMMGVQGLKNEMNPMNLLQGGGMDDAGGFTVLGKRAG
jgi:muramidase (phage lysozyme)